MVLQQSPSPRCDVQNYGMSLRISNAPSSMESRKFRVAKQAMEHMSHLMEERHNVIMPHQSGPFSRGLGQIGNHCGYWVASLPIRAVVT